MSLFRVLVAALLLTPALLLSACPTEGRGVGLRVAIEPENPGDDDNLVVTVLTSPVGADEDGFAYRYAWSTDAGPIEGQARDTLGFSETSVGQVITVTVTPTWDDGFEGTPAVAAVTIAGGDDADGDGFGADDDCNDQDPAINPAATELCDGLDNDCSGTPDDGTSGDFVDGDSDGFDNCGDDGLPGGTNADCNDANGNVHPGADEVCDGTPDNDCDGEDDPQELDGDSDGVTGCAGDCDDGDGDLNPLDVDEDGQSSCDGDCDDSVPGINDLDEDGDGVSTCDTPVDCDDDDQFNFPGNPELCDGEDNDCDGNAEVGTADEDNDGFTLCDGDCDDSAATGATVFPGATEVCNGIDEDCNSVVDDGFPDLDGDGTAACAGDCNDDPATSGASMFPGNPEVCDALDNDCVGGVDEGFDVDGDGFTTCGADGVPGTADDDCDDSATGNAINPSAVESCDGVDEDCDGTVDDGFDLDGDGTTTCGPDGIAGNADDDCNDDPNNGGAAQAPGNVETVDGVDEDCDGTVDEYTWTQISVIFGANCSCHLGNHSTGFSFVSVPTTNYLTLVSPSGAGVPSSQSALNRVEPNDATLSYLMHKLDDTQLQAPANGSGLQMPRGLTPLSQADRDGIRAWINSGAPQD